MRLLQLLDHPAAPVALRCYYEQWAGRRFESLGRHDDAVYEQNVITPTDIVAVRLLNVDVPPGAIIQLLERDLGRQVSALLTGVPANVELGTPDARYHLGPDGPAQKAWELLRANVGGGKGDGQAWVTAGKLLARKRPQLIPVYDSVVKCVLSLPIDENYWLWLDEQLQRLDMRERLGELRARARVPAQTLSVKVELDTP